MVLVLTVIVSKEKSPEQRMEFNNGSTDKLLQRKSRFVKDDIDATSGKTRPRHLRYYGNPSGLLEDQYLLLKE